MPPGLVFLMLALRDFLMVIMIMIMMMMIVMVMTINLYQQENYVGWQTRFLKCYTVSLRCQTGNHPSEIS